MSALRPAALRTSIRRAVGRGSAIAVLAVACTLVLRPIAPAAATEVERVVSPGGIEAWLVEAHAVPVIALSASFAGGNGSDPDTLERNNEILKTIVDRRENLFGIYAEVLRPGWLRVGDPVAIDDPPEPAEAGPPLPAG